jgi:succinoglycan biosynthesis protein ExoA
MSTDNPFVTVIMPVRNEADFIARSLTSVLNQDYPRDRTEILIADGMSIDATREIIAQCTAAYPDASVKVFDNPKQIVPTGMNLALREARGQIIVRIDGHCEIASDYISRCVEHLLADSVDGVGGPIETIGSTPISETIALAMSSAFGVGGSAFRTVKGRQMLVDTVAFPAYTRHSMETAGPYDERLVRNQDDEYNYRLRRLGFKILLSPDIHARYYSRGSLVSLWRQYFQYGFYKVLVMRKHPWQMRPRQFVPPVFVTGLIGGAAVGVIIPVVLRFWAVGLAFYIITGMCISVQLATQHGWRHLTRLPLVFLILHLSYGLGFLVGLVKPSRWRERA